MHLIRVDETSDTIENIAIFARKTVCLLLQRKLFIKSCRYNQFSREQFKFGYFTLNNG